ncbi:DUF4221 domain-containing protein [Algoriphagus halophytocola]|uniref:DUF4221 domain-containing protein n=1 Tax=Algoriphagus halophytocola TaxID=2991499 RepID=A0ABY6MG75_9BACT|nr:MULTISPECIES: DUF4221 domain-containing protein [unclassified Algoriphagus]UZD21631.1 DUF4221 domain-containing protein [Algoriphagus sp. TR-M5]WBL42843.1 DUF4221 domain-containing protein [Algoriphagus sp. TR-M9]
MKRPLILILITVVCHSCSKQSNESEQGEFDFSYSIDTVMVDPGDEIIYLKRGLNTAALSPDNTQLFNFNPDLAEFEVIDLDNLKLQRRIKMEKEGPLGTGNPRNVLISTDGRFFFTSFVDVREFNSQLDSMETYKIRTEKFEALNLNEALGADYQISPDGKYLFVPYGPEDYLKPNTGLVILKLEDLSLKKIPMDLWERAHAYVRTFLQDGEPVSWTNEFVYADPIDHRVLLSSHNFNEVYILDLTTDSISHKVFHSTITQDSKKIPSKTTFDSPSEMRGVFQDQGDQVEFSKFYYDDSREIFMRFSRDLDRKIGDSSVYKHVTTLFDINLNQLHEEEIPIPFFGFKFFKDGKLYSYVNVEDELGLAVFTFDF